MTKAQGRRQSLGILGLLLSSILFVCLCASALDPALDVSQYAHTAWKVRDGAFKGTIKAIAQTSDGYLWLGTEFGLLRFDGVRVVPWQPPPSQYLPSNNISALLVTRSGTLWIGTWKGLASWKDGKLTHYPELAELIILRLLEDREGTLWAGAYGIPAGRLCAVQKGSAHCYGEDGGFGPGVVGVYEDRKGNLWAGVRDGLWRWKPGPPKFYPLPGEPDGILGMTEDADGAILLGWKGGIYRVVAENVEPYPVLGAVRGFRVQCLLRDRNGGLWVGTRDHGLLHVHQGRVEVLTSVNGLSSDWVGSIFEDREASVWVATFGGLDRFRDFAVATLSTKEGLSRPIVGSVLAAKDGSVWLGTSGGLNRWFNGQISAFGKRDGKINGNAPHSMFQDSQGRIWVSTFYNFGYLENDRFVSINGLPGGIVHGIGEDSDGNLWIANKESGLFRLSSRNEIQKLPWSALKAGDYAEALVVDSLHGGVWLGFSLGGVTYLADGRVRQSYATADGLGEGAVGHLRLGPDGTLWAATEGGLSRLKNGRITTLTSKNGLPCDTVHWSIEDDAHSLWLYMACGLVRIPKDELDAWSSATDKDRNGKKTIRATVYDISDGVRSHSPGGYFPPVAKSTDGRLWFLPFDGVSVVDPQHLPFNKLAPPVHIEQMVVDRKTYDTSSVANEPARLPPLVRDLEIDYTALSLAAPEKVLFKYKLEGFDSDWHDAGNRRQAFYTNLPPKNYAFQVKACNNSGVWNEAGASLDFSVAPAYYQTTWFRLSCAAALLALAYALYQLRVRQVVHQFNMRLEERVSERTRIARDLHDTLLQGFQGLLLQFKALSYQLPDSSEFRTKLENLIDKARAAVTEGRDAVQGLRASTVVGNDLAQSINALGEELAADPTVPDAPDFQVLVEGTPRNLVPILRDEVYQIAGEAMRNAFRHAHAKRIEVEIEYGERHLCLRVRDDGKGIDPKIEEEGGRAGHYGIPGMRERAKLIGADLDVWSEIQSGTEIELEVPGTIAYAKQPAARRSGFSHKEA